MILHRARSNWGIDETYWDDLRVPVTATRVGSSRTPGFAQFKDDGSSSQGVFLYWFDDSTEEEVYFTVQIPHSYKLETDIVPHVHWTPASNGSAGEVVSWGFEYTWAEIGGDWGDSTMIYTNTHTPADASLVAGRHYFSSFADVSGSGIDTVSSMLVCRLFRDAAGNGATDDLSGDAGLAEIDFHFQLDTPGSRQETVK